MQHLKDPAAGVAQALLPHVHLVSKSRYPVQNNPSLESIVSYLADAPKIVRDLQPMQWQILDAPQDGTMLLVWQPLEYLGTNSASDGYIYADAEQYFKSEVRGFQLEMFYHRTGYRPGEPVASHSRKRYRLVPTNPSMPNCDQSLFLISYSKASPRDTIPSASIPLVPQLQQQMQQRRVIQAQGQLARKEFMLHDRSNWPTINAPQAVARSQGAHRRGGSVSEVTLEEEEDVSRGDILDFMSPRDISRVRYEQHHEWMEEILESPYHISRIVPGDLGLGRCGELEMLTKDFFDAPITVLRETSGNGDLPRIGRLENGKVDDFSARASQKIAEMEAEIQKMKQRHTERLARLKRTSVLSSSEKKLRSAPTASERRTSAGSPAEQQSTDALDEIAQDVENSLGRKIERLANISLVSRGGLEERASDRSMSMSSQTKPQMSPVKSAASPAIPQQPPVQQQPVPPQSTPQMSVPETQGAVENGHTNGSEPPSIPDAVQQEAVNKPATPANDEDAQELNLDDVGQDLDVNMDVFEGNADDDLVNPDNDWVMDMDGSGNNEEEQVVAEETKRIDSGAAPAEAEAEAEAQATKPDAPRPEPSHPHGPTSAEQTPNTGTPAEHSSNEQQMESNEFGEAFENVEVDTAGDALAGYGDDDEEEEDEEELNLDGMDDSEFFNTEDMS